MEKVTELLNLIKAQAKAHAVVLVTGDGLILDGAAEPDTDMDAIAAYAASYAVTSARMAEETQFGPVDSVLVIYRDQAMIVAPVDAEVSIAVIGTGGAQLGKLRLLVQRHLTAMATALRDDAQRSFVPLIPVTEATNGEHTNGAEGRTPQSASLKASG